MFEAFYWMFKAKDIKKHFVYLLSVVLICYVITIINCVLTFNVSKYQEILISAATVFAVIPVLTLLGYFWNLTECIIDRKFDISSASIFNGKLKKVYTITLPEISIKRFVWRGIASIVASLLLSFPVFSMLNLSMNSAMVFNPAIYTGISVFIGLFIPALLWNYAKNDSIFSVLNFPKAIYVMGNYTGKYILNTAVFVIFSFITSLIINCFYNILGLNEISPAYILESAKYINFILFTLLVCVLNIYTIFVNAYLLGTIAPPDEK